MGTVVTLDAGRRAAALAAFEAACFVCGPVDYGASDCATLAADAIRAATGKDLLARWRGRYRTARGWLRVIRRDGLADLAAAVRWAAAEHGLPPIVASAACDLDLALVASRRQVGPGLVKQGFVLMRIDGGMAAEPIDAALQLWRVG